MNYKAIKTEYNGVVYDSKSEAIFARTLELCGLKVENCHPIRHDKHDWDFLIWEHDYDQSFCSCYEGIDDEGPLGTTSTFAAPRGYAPVLIELKPSRPTNQYIKSLMDRMIWFQGEQRLVVWGSPFEDRLQDWAGFSCRYLAIEVGKWRRHSPYEEVPLEMVIGQFNERNIKKAMEYRFDLQGGGLRR